MPCMLQSGVISARFSTYWDEMTRCENAGAYWALLHLTVCLPDICAALEASDGESSKVRYVSWCDRFATQPYLTGGERYRMRCKVLHQGRTRTDQPGRYSGFSFGRPAIGGQIDHNRTASGVLHIDVGTMAREITTAVERWITWLENNPGAPESVAVERNLPSLVRVDQVRVQIIGTPRTFIVAKTN